MVDRTDVSGGDMPELTMANPKTSIARSSASAVPRGIPVPWLRAPCCTRARTDSP